MNLYSVNTGYFKLDGGAMFGVVPKSIWNGINPADENNMCRWAMRSLLVEDGDRLVLIDNGIGNKQDDKFFGYYYLHGDDSLDKSLAKHGFHRSDITDVFLTHLHFDHCGGSIEWDEEKNGYRPAFPNAVFWSNEKHWNWAVHPNPREKASFLKENILPIQESGQLKFLEDGQEVIPGMRAIFVNGHTEAQMLAEINTGNRKVLFTADLTPSAGHLKSSYVMGYDIRPLVVMEEKERILKQAAAENTILFFEHDPVNEAAVIEWNERGPVVKEKGDLTVF